MEQYRHSINGVSVRPHFNDEMSLVYEKESNYNFFRSKLSNGVSFVGYDFDLLASQDIETEFLFRIDRYYYDNKVWEPYFIGKFYKTDGKWNYHDKKVTVSITPKDAYDDILAGLDKEFSLVQIANQKDEVTFERKGALQIYIEGADTITNIYENIHSEQKVNRVCWKDELVKDLCFWREQAETVIKITKISDTYDYLEGDYIGYTAENPDGSIYHRMDSKYYIKINYLVNKKCTYTIYDSSNDNEVTGFETTEIKDMQQVYNNTGATKYYKFNIVTNSIYCRAVTDWGFVEGIQTKPIPENDIVDCVYTRVAAYSYGVKPVIGFELSDSKTEYGKQPYGDKYYVKPQDENKVLFPLDRSSWNSISYWVSISAIDMKAIGGLAQYAKIQDGYRLSTVINGLLSNIANLKEEIPYQVITHEATPECSQFLYGYHKLFDQIDSNPTLLITQKTNIFKNYERAATKTPITLGQILKMLKVCYDCDWFIENGKLKIEHSEFFKRGGTYDTNTNIIDLTQMTYAKNNKSWAYGASNIEYEKKQMPERYAFKWHDDVSPEFDNIDVEVQSRFVSRGKTEEQNVGEFTSDINHMLLDMGNISKDGYVLMAANGWVNDEGSQVYKITQTHKEIAPGEYIVLQNRHLSFSNLINYLTFNMPSRNIVVNGMVREANGTMYGRTSTVRFPAVDGLTTTSRIKTSIGIGIIDKFSVNLCSEMVTATIKYDTYE